MDEMSTARVSGTSQRSPFLQGHLMMPSPFRPTYLRRHTIRTYFTVGLKFEQLTLYDGFQNSYQCICTA